MSDIKTRKTPGESGIIPKLIPSWHTPEEKVYRCKVILLQEEGGYSVYAATLPGVASQGETEDDALHNITEALEGVLATYREQDQEIPWSEETAQKPRNAEVRWVVVHG